MKRKITVLAVLALVGFAGSSFGAGFALIEQSVKGLGNSFAGGAAIADDATTIFFNPAGMSRLDGMNATAGLHYIAPSAKYTNTAATVPAALGGGVQTGGEGGEAGQPALVPNFYFSAEAGENCNYGISVNTPFGLATKFDEDWVGRFHGIESDLMTININPSTSYKFNDNFSFGIGFSAQYLDVTLSQESVLPTGLPAPFPPYTSSYTEMTGDSWGYGYNFGALFEFNEHVRIGASYRSAVFHSLEGDMDIRLNGSTLPITAKITLPASAQVSVFYRINDKFDVMADVMWTDWSVFEDLTVQLPTSTNVTEENWKDNMRYSVGATFRPVDVLSLRAGVAYDETPIPDANRTPRIPGADRIWISIGAGYALDAWNFDFAYAHLFVDDGSINLIDTTGKRGNLAGTFENSVDMVSVEATYKF